MPLILAPTSRVHRPELRSRLLTGGRPRPARAILRQKRKAIATPRRFGLLRTIAGWVLLVLGLVGIVLPLLPAIVLIPAGVALIGRNSKVIQFFRARTKLLLRLAETWPGIWGRMGRWLATKERRFSKRLRDRRMRKHAG